MQICQNCQEEYNPRYEQCPFCGAYPIDQLENEDELIIAFQAGDETEAFLIKGILEGEGIPVMIRSRQVPMYDGIFTYGESCWGDLLIHTENVKRSQKLISDYLEKTAESY